MFFFKLEFEFVTLHCESKISVGAKLPSWMECDVWHTSLTKPNCPNILGANALCGNIASSIFHCSTQTNCPHSALKHFWSTLLSIEEARRALLALIQTSAGLTDTGGLEHTHLQLFPLLECFCLFCTTQHLHITLVTLVDTM